MLSQFGLFFVFFWYCDAMGALREHYLARVNTGAALCSLLLTSTQHAHTHTRLLSAEASTQSERGEEGLFAALKSQLWVRSERSPLFSSSTGPWSLHGTPESAAQPTATLCHGLPRRGEPFPLQGSIQIRCLFNTFCFLKVFPFFHALISNLMKYPLCWGFVWCAVVWSPGWGGGSHSCSSLSAVSAAAAAVTQPRQEMTEQQF